MRKFIYTLIFVLGLFPFTGCDLIDDFLTIDEAEQIVENKDIIILDIDELQDIAHFRKGALEHILEGELNARGQAVGYHYDQLPTKKGKIIEGTKTDPNEYGVYEAVVEVDGVKKTSNKGRSTFFPDNWNAQEVVDAINEAYDSKSYLTGNTYEGLTAEGVAVRMYLDNEEKIISAFPIY